MAILSHVILCFESCDPVLLHCSILGDRSQQIAVAQLYFSQSKDRYEKTGQEEEALQENEEFGPVSFVKSTTNEKVMDLTVPKPEETMPHQFGGVLFVVKGGNDIEPLKPVGGVKPCFEEGTASLCCVTEECQDEVVAAVMKDEVVTAVMKDEVVTAVMKDEVVTAVMKDEVVTAVTKDEVVTAVTKDEVVTAVMKIEAASSSMSHKINQCQGFTYDGGFGHLPRRPSCQTTTLFCHGLVIENDMKFALLVMEQCISLRCEDFFLSASFSSIQVVAIDRPLSPMDTKALPVQEHERNSSELGSQSVAGQFIAIPPSICNEVAVIQSRVSYSRGERGEIPI